MRGALLAISSVGMGPPRSQPARPVDSLSRTAALGRPITSASFLGACDLPGRRAGSHSCRARLRAFARGGRRGVRGGVPPEPMRAPPAPDAQSRRPCPPRLIALKDSDGKARRRWGTEVQAVGSRLSGPPDFTYDHPRKAQTNKRVLHWIVDGADHLGVRLISLIALIGQRSTFRRLRRPWKHAIAVRGAGFGCLSGGWVFASSGDSASGNPAFAISRGPRNASPLTPGHDRRFPGRLLSLSLFRSG